LWDVTDSLVDDLLWHLVLDLGTVEGDRPAHVTGQAEHRFHDGGLAGTVRADDGDVLAVVDEQVDIGEYLEVTVASVESGDVEEVVTARVDPGAGGRSLPVDGRIAGVVCFGHQTSPPR
jgi:hypothetical protein